MADLPVLARLLHFLAHEGAELCQGMFDADSCIASTNVALKVLDYFDVCAYPKQVRCDFWLLDQSYGVGIGGSGSHSEARWDGHLVIVVPIGDTQVLLDMTSAQFSRPKQGLEVPPALTVELPEEWDSFSTESVASYRIGQDRAMRYIPIDADETGWRTSGDWTDVHGGVRAAAALIVRAFREKEHGHDIEWEIDIDRNTHEVRHLGFRLK